VPVTSPGLIIAISLLGGLLALATALIILNLRSVKACIHRVSSRLDKHDNDIKELGEDFLKCKIDCDRNTVSKEDWVRSEGFTRKELKEVSGVLSRIEGKIAIAEKVPEIVGSTVRAVVKELNGHGRQA